VPTEFLMRLGPHPEADDLVREVVDDHRQLRAARQSAREQNALADLLAAVAEGVDAAVLLTQQGTSRGRVGYGGEVGVEFIGAAGEPVRDARKCSTGRPASRPTVTARTAPCTS
jgi:hypothetical protein